MMKQLFLLFFLLLITLSNHYNCVYGQQQQQQQNDDDCCEEYCYSKDSEKEQIQHYSTKTAYEHIKPNETEFLKVFSNIKEYQKCNPTKIWILSRHGTRLPNEKFIKAMNQLKGVKNETARNYANRTYVPSKGKLCPPDLINLKVWKVNSSITVDKANELTGQGYEDLRLLAKNYQKALPSILNQTYNSSVFKFYTSDTNRTKESLTAFATGLFGQTKNYFIKILNNSFIRPEEDCELYKEQNHDDNKNPESEIRKFKLSEIFNKTVQHVSKRLGYKQILPDEIVLLMWDMCRYEQAWHVSRSSPWCAAFTPTQNKVFEYKEDLKYYYKSGHGHDLNTRMACFAIQDMLKNLNSQDQPQVVALFSHSSLVQFLLVALGAFKDKEPLKADNYEQMENRLWRTSSIVPFASNIAAIKYDCAPESNGDAKILFLLNERPLDIEGCNNGVCDWSYIMTKYEDFINANCQEYYCTSKGIKINNISLNLLTISSFIIYIILYFIF